MERDFWRLKWRANELGWHQASPNPMLVAHLDALGLPPGSRVLVPLCGKTLDIGWLMGRGLRVVGVELVESAVRELFAGLGIEPRIEDAGRLRRFSGDGIDVFVGDLFELDAAIAGAIDGVWDRAALVAMPFEMRLRYARQIKALAGSAPQLLVTFVYDEAAMAGPPFSVTPEEVTRLYGDHFAVALLEDADVEGGLKGVCPAREQVWRLTPGVDA